MPPPGTYSPSSCTSNCQPQKISRPPTQASTCIGRGGGGGWGSEREGGGWTQGEGGPPPSLFFVLMRAWGDGGAPPYNFYVQAHACQAPMSFKVRTKTAPFQLMKALAATRNAGHANGGRKAAAMGLHRISTDELLGLALSIRNKSGNCACVFRTTTSLLPSRMSAVDDVRSRQYFWLCRKIWSWPQASAKPRVDLGRIKRQSFRALKWQRFGLVCTSHQFQKTMRDGGQRREQERASVGHSGRRQECKGWQWHTNGIERWNKVKGVCCEGGLHTWSKQR